LGDALRVLVGRERGLGDEREAYIPCNGKKIEQCVVLENVAAFGSKTAQRFGLVEGSVLVGECACVGLEEADQKAEEDRLAGAAFS
jgi:hypothetical protein